MDRSVEIRDHEEMVKTMDAILSGLVRIGKVTDRDTSSGKVRVLFPDSGLTSDWLFCLQNMAPITIGTAEEHTHTASSGIWTPTINQVVACLYLPMPDADGFVLGTIGGAP